MKLACAALVCAALAAPLGAATAPRTIDVSGSYDSNWGHIELRQHGVTVIGTYDSHTAASPARSTATSSATSGTRTPAPAAACSSSPPTAS